MVKINKNGQVIVYGFMLGVVIIILAMAFAGPIKKFTDNAQNKTSEIGGMDCSNESISNFDKLNCLSTDLSLPYFIGALLAIGGIILTAKIILS